jgi:hypothetical protein
MAGAAVHLDLFEQPGQKGLFQQPASPDPKIIQNQ